MNASISPKQAFGAESKNAALSFASAGRTASGAALSNADYLRESCAEMRLGTGPRDHQDCPHRVTFDRFSACDSDALDVVIRAAYRHVFGNCYVMANERSDELESQLKDGRLCVREFIRGLAKTDYYKSRFFAGVAPNRGVELTYKHVLGRPPLSQEEVAGSIALQAASGFDALVDSLVDSAEYTEVFGDETVPYARAWTSAGGMSMMNFVRIAALEQSFNSSDRAKGSSSILLNNLAAGTSLPIKRPASVDYVGMSASWSGGKPPVNYEKLWRGIALVGAAHLGGMMINVTTQILGIHTLDRIPAMFLGL